MANIGDVTPFYVTPAPPLMKGIKMTEEIRIIAKEEFEEYRRLKAVIPEVVSIITTMDLTCKNNIDFHDKKIRCMKLLLGKE